MTGKFDYEYIRKLVADFAKERDWEQFHSPKNLAMALNVEAGELLEIFQWLSEKESYELKESSSKLRQALEDEVADVMAYLIRLCDVLDIDLEMAIKNKMIANAQKYPVEKSKGKATKYNKL